MTKTMVLLVINRNVLTVVVADTTLCIKYLLSTVVSIRLIIVVSRVVTISLVGYQVSSILLCVFHG